MRPSTFDIDVADEDTDGYANDDASGNAGSVTLAVTTPTDGLAHKVVITPSGSVSGSYTLVGTDADGKALTETLATNTTSAVTSTNYFKTLTSVTNATVGSETIDVGWADEVASQTIPIDRLSNNQANIQVDVTGTINFTVQELWANVYDYEKPQQTAPWLSITALASKTADTASQATKGATAVRVILNSYSSGAELQMYVNQPLNQ